MNPDDKDPAEEADEIINESDEGIDELLEDTEVADDTESYDESDSDFDGSYDYDDGDPEELDFE